MVESVAAGVYKEPGGSKQAGEGRGRSGKYALLTRLSFGAARRDWPIVLWEPRRSPSWNEKVFFVFSSHSAS